MLGASTYTLRVFSEEVINITNFRKTTEPEYTDTEVYGSVQPDPNARYKINVTPSLRGYKIEDLMVFYCYEHLTITIGENNKPQFFYGDKVFEVHSVADYNEHTPIPHTQLQLVFLEPTR
jgi:hypothetical protein